MKCAFCGGAAAAADVSDASLGDMLGPMGHTSSGDPIYVHRQCALWSPEVYQGSGGLVNKLLNVDAAVRRGRTMRCCHCERRGATLGCRVERCPNSFHLACAGAAGCTFYPAKFLVACQQHAPMFQAEPGAERADPRSPSTPWRRSTRASAAARHEARRSRAGGKRSADDLAALAREAAAAKRLGRHVRHAARAAAELSSDDEQHFWNKEASRLRADRDALRPIMLGGKPTAEEQGVGTAAAAGSGPAPFRGLGWDAVGGNAVAMRQLREMVVLPLLYPDVFSHMGIRAPRGILLHGEPGCGKTLAVRALAGACSRADTTRPVALFARKAADCLGKFYGDAERTLRLLFEEASKAAPAIIFLDEMDALAPVRSTREGGADQIYASVVSTLLALMDGLADRGNVVVIAATNRPDAIDPALRRPGRFDRECYFGLPSQADRAAILRVHTARWPALPAEEAVQRLAAATHGCAGADIAALCAGAVMAAARRAAPQLSQELGRPAADTTPGPGLCSAARGGWVDTLEITAEDWAAALAAAPKPSAQRGGRAALGAAAAARPLPQHVAVALLPALSASLHTLRFAGVALPAAAAAAVAAEVAAGSATAQPGAVSAAAPSGTQRLVDALVQCGALVPPPCNDTIAAQPNGQPSQRAVKAAGSTAPMLMGSGGMAEPVFGLLLGGEGEAGQQAAAGALLRLFEDSQLHMLSLPAMLVAGNGDVLEGCTTVLREARRCATPGTLTVLYAPRIEAWAVRQLAEDADAAYGDDSGLGASLPPLQGMRSLDLQMSHSPPGVAVPVRQLQTFADTRAAADAVLSPEPQVGKRWAAGQRHTTAAPQHGAGVPAAEMAPIAASAAQMGDEAEAAPKATDAWAVAEHVLRSWPRDALLLLLATCHVPIASLPPAVGARFGSTNLQARSAATAGATVQLSQELGHATWRAALAAAAAGAAAEAAGAAIREARRQLRAVAAVHPAAACEAGPKQQPSAGPATAEPHAASGAQPGAQAAGTAASLLMAHNAQELQQALHLHAQVRVATQRFGVALLRDGRTRLAKAHVHTKRKRGGNSQLTTGVLKERRVAVADVAQRAALGAFATPAELEVAVYDVTRQVAAALSAQAAAAPAGLAGYSPALAAAHALQDQVSAWRYAVDSQLGLAQPAAARLLGIATAHLRQKAVETAAAAAEAAAAAAQLPEAAGGAAADLAKAAADMHVADADAVVSGSAIGAGARTGGLAEEQLAVPDTSAHAQPSGSLAAAAVYSNHEATDGGSVQDGVQAPATPELSPLRQARPEAQPDAQLEQQQPASPKTPDQSCPSAPNEANATEAYECQAQQQRQRVAQQAALAQLARDLQPPLQEVISGHLLDAAGAYAPGACTVTALDDLSAAASTAAASAVQKAVGSWAPEMLRHTASEDADEGPLRGAVASICAAVQACLTLPDHTSV